jgi:hypothetical protein
MPNVNIISGNIRSVFLIAASLVVLLTADASAQPSKKVADPFDYLTLESNNDLKAIGQEVSAMIRGKQFKDVTINGKTVSGQIAMKAFYDGFEIPRWTQKANIYNFPNTRKTLATLFKNSGSSPAAENPVMDYFRDKVLLPGLTKLAQGGGDAGGKQFHPAVRIEAMLTIGELNSLEIVRSSDLPTPLPDALTVMLDAIESPTPPVAGGQDVAKVTGDDGVKIAAFAGIYRHVKLSNGLAKSDARKKVLLDAYNILKTSDIPPGRSPSTQSWLRMQAAEILGELGEVGGRGAVPNALSDLIKDSETNPATGEPKVLLMTRCTAARALGKLKYTAAGVTDPMPWVIALCKLARDTCPAEVDRGYSTARMKDCLDAVNSGLMGIEPLCTEADQKATLAAIKKTLESMKQNVGSKETSAASKELVECREKLDSILSKAT